MYKADYLKQVARVFFVYLISFVIELRLNKDSTKLQQRCDTHVRTYYIARRYLEIDIEKEKKEKVCVCFSNTHIFV